MWPFGLEFACWFSGSSVQLSLRMGGGWPVLFQCYISVLQQHLPRGGWVSKWTWTLPLGVKSLQSYNLGICVTDIRTEATKTMVGGGVGMQRKKNSEQKFKCSAHWSMREDGGMTGSGWQHVGEEVLKWCTPVGLKDEIQRVVDELALDSFWD